MRRLTALSPETLVAQRAMNTIRSAQMDKLQSGKVFHTKHHARQKNEKYYTPAWATEALLRQLDLSIVMTTWEPAAGDGAIVRVLRNHVGHVVGTDISPDNEEWMQPRSLNFLLQQTHGRDIGAIVTNPPFGPSGATAFQFCWHALRLMQPQTGIVAMLMRDDFDSAGGRQQLFKFHPAWHKKVILTTRIRWTNLPQKKAGPSGNHAWYIWDWSREPGPAMIAYEGMEP